MEVKLGYKQTEVGVIPEEWEVKTLGEIGDVRMCKRVLKQQTRSHGDVPFYKIGTFGGVADAYISGSLFEEFRRKYSFPKKGDVLISAAGTIGRSVVFDGASAYFQDSNIVWIENDESKATNEYLWHRYQVTKWAVSHGGTVARLYNDSLRTKIYLPVPPLPEQRAIAAALSDVDVLLGGLDRLIAKNRDLRTGAMQRLLTGETRLPGFSGEWEVMTLGELFDLSAGKSKTAFVTDEGDYWVCDMGSVSTEGKLIVSKRTNYCGDFLREGDLVMPKDDIGGGGIIGKVGYIDANVLYVLGDHVYRLRAREGDSRFLAYIINSHRINSELRRKVIGSAQLGLGRRSVEEQEVTVPKPPEQTAIAAVLSDMDGELAALEARRDKTRDLKQAMMQELLTGKTRLVKPEAAHA